MGFKLFVALSVLALVSLSFAADAGTDFPSGSMMSGQSAWNFLMAGNQRFVDALNSNADHLNLTLARRQALYYEGQLPAAIVLTCTDSRVPPELLFDVGMGDLFVIRIAGNVLTNEILGTIDYALEHFGSNLIVIMGHNKCGAVTAAMHVMIESMKAGATSSASPSTGNLNYDALMSTMYPSVKASIDKYGNRTEQAIDYATELNIFRSCNMMVTNSPLVRSSMIRTDFKIVLAEYDILNGTVTALGTGADCTTGSQYAINYAAGTTTVTNVLGSTKNVDIENVAAAMIALSYFFIVVTLGVWFQKWWNNRQASEAKLEAVRAV